MGMFDHIRSLVPLPDGWGQGQWLQTKDFDRFMDNYEIREDGTLWVERSALWRDEKKSEQLASFSGVVNFYGLERVKPAADPPFYKEDEHRWHEYEARFENGRLLGMEVAQSRDVEHEL